MKESSLPPCDGRSAGRWILRILFKLYTASSHSVKPHAKLVRENMDAVSANQCQGLMDSWPSFGHTVRNLVLETNDSHMATQLGSGFSRTREFAGGAGSAPSARRRLFEFDRRLIPPD